MIIDVDPKAWDELTKPKPAEVRPTEIVDVDQSVWDDMLKVGKEAIAAPVTPTPQVDKFLEQQEGYRTNVYKDTAGHLTVGYGHKLTPDEIKQYQAGKFDTSPERLKQLYDQDTQIATKLLDSRVKVPLSDPQRKALTSFIYNVGTGAFQSSTLLKKLNAGDYTGASNELLKWNKVTNPTTGQKEVSKGLSLRRQRERDLFNSKVAPAETPMPTPKPATISAPSAPAWTVSERLTSIPTTRDEEAATAAMAAEATPQERAADLAALDAIARQARLSVGGQTYQRTERGTWKKIQAQ